MNEQNHNKINQIVNSDFDFHHLFFVNLDSYKETKLFVVFIIGLPGQITMIC